MTHICVSNKTIIGSDNGLSPGRREAIIWTNAGILLIRTLGTNFSEILSEIHKFSLKKMHFQISSGKCRPFCLGLNVLKDNMGPMCWESSMMTINTVHFCDTNLWMFFNKEGAISVIFVSDTTKEIPFIETLTKIMFLVSIIASLWSLVPASYIIITSRHWNNLCITVPLYRESPSYRWIPSTKGSSNADLR